MASTAPAMNRETMRYVPLDSIVESKTNPRKHFDKKSLHELTISVAEKGILVPLLVRKTITVQEGGDHALDAFEIVAGARRFRAAKEASLEQIPVIVRELDDLQALEVQVIENLQRCDVHPLEEAEGYKQLLAAGKYKDVDALAVKVGKSTSYVYQRLKLAELIQPAKKAFEEEKISAGHAILIARLQSDAQKEALTYCTDRWHAASVRDLADWIERNIHLDLAKAPWKKDDAELVPSAGPCISCPKRTGASPALFEDIKKGDTCTDPTCFRSKQSALVKIKMAEHPGIRIVSNQDAYSGNDEKALNKQFPGILMERQYRKAGALKCKHTTQALVVHGDGLGTRINVCLAEKRCKVHSLAEQSYRAPTRSPKEIEAAKRAEAKQELNDKIERTAFVDALGKIRKAKALPAVIWRLLAVASWNNSYGEDDWAEAIGETGEINEKNIRAFDSQTAIAYLFATLMSPSNVPSEDVLEAARLVGVDVAAIRVKLTAEAKSHASAKPGKCRICGCTEKRACQFIAKNKGGKGSVAKTCSWTDATKTLCNKPQCVKAAEKEKAA